jgi:serine/threonine-protein kinase
MTAPAQIGVVAQYNLLEQLEPVGPGDLFRARDTHRGRTVVVRLLPRELTPTEASRTAFIDQARALGAFSHPNATLLYDAGEHEGRVYIAFEFIQGEPLRAEMAGRPLNIRRALEIAIQIADAVADAHAAGFLHSGLSPDSVMITTKGSAKVPAFELAVRAGVEVIDGDVRLLDYEAPEEARGEAVDERADVYSVGAILYEMLTARRPMHKGAAAPSAANSRVSGEIDAIVLKALAPNPASRQASAATLAAELRGVLPAVDSVGAGETETPVETTSLSIVVVAALVAVAVFVGLLYWFTRS